MIGDTHVAAYGKDQCSDLWITIADCWCFPQNTAQSNTSDPDKYVRLFQDMCVNSIRTEKRPVAYCLLESCCHSSLTLAERSEDSPKDDAVLRL